MVASNLETKLEEYKAKLSQPSPEWLEKVNAFADKIADVLINYVSDKELTCDRIPFICQTFPCAMVQLNNLDDDYKIIFRATLALPSTTKADEDLTPLVLKQAEVVAYFNDTPDDLVYRHDLGVAHLFGLINLARHRIDSAREVRKLTAEANQIQTEINTIEVGFGEATDKFLKKVSPEIEEEAQKLAQWPLSNKKGIKLYKWTVLDPTQETGYSVLWAMNPPDDARCNDPDFLKIQLATGITYILKTNLLEGRPQEFTSVEDLPSEYQQNACTPKRTFYYALSLKAVINDNGVSVIPCQETMSIDDDIFSGGTQKFWSEQPLDSKYHQWQETSICKNVRVPVDAIFNLPDDSPLWINA